MSAREHRPAAARPTRRDLLRWTAAAAGTVALRSIPAAGEKTTFPLEIATFDDLAAALAAGRLTPASLRDLYLERIASHDAGASGTNALLEVDELARPAVASGPLHGLPILLKDNIETAGAMLTTAGSLALAEAPAGRDAFLVRRLRAHGAVILGKTNLSEWATFRSTRSTSGWSGRGGQTRNPYALDRNPCGSSSGSGVAASAAYCAAAVGTETDGSVVCPANASGVVGVKPTLGLVSRRGIVPIAHSQDTAGPMARTVRDAALLLAGMAGTDLDDPATAEIPAAWRDDYFAALTARLDVAALEGARLGVVRGLFGFDSRVDALMEDALAALSGAGATLVDPVELPHRGEYDDAEWTVLKYEFKADLEGYLRTRADTRMRTLADLIAFNEAHRAQEMPWFGQEIFEQCAELGPLTEPEYLEARELCRRLSRREGIDAALSGHRLDALVAPTGGPAWLTDWVNGDSYGGGFSTAAAVAGYPHVTVPAGFVAGLPVGLSIFGGAWSEPALLGYAYAFERATRHRQAPGFLPSVRPAA
ncbi:MAG: amidase [Thermoanaerobaculia bacterium]